MNPLLRTPAVCLALLSVANPLAQEPLQPPPAVRFLGISWSEASSPIGFQVNLHGSIDDGKLGHRYEVRYQLRLHEQKGVEGPVLGDAAHPGGTAYVLGAALAPDAEGMCLVTFTFDLLRKDLGNCVFPGRGRFVIRVEPQVYDLTAEQFLTPAKSNALIAVAEVADDGRVWTVVPFGQWFAGCYGERTAQPALELLASLDAYDLEGNAIVPAFEQLFASEYIKPKELLLVLDALPAKELAFGKNNLRGCIEGLLAHKDERVRAAAAQKQQQAAALQAERK